MAAMKEDLGPQEWRPRPREDRRRRRAQARLGHLESSRQTRVGEGRRRVQAWSPWLWCRWRLFMSH